jgi:hypothetical protein
MMTIEQIKQRAASLAAALKAGNAITREQRKDFIALRTALFQRGVYDPVLVRFDSVTAPPATPAEIAEELEALAASLAV